jgi:hypothetical protein
MISYPQRLWNVRENQVMWFNVIEAVDVHRCGSSLQIL